MKVRWPAAGGEGDVVGEDGAIGLGAADPQVHHVAADAEALGG
jgi:hypothetical protein